MMSMSLSLQRYIRGILMMIDCQRHSGLFGSLRQREFLMMSVMLQLEVLRSMGEILIMTG